MNRGWEGKGWVHKWVILRHVFSGLLQGGGTAAGGWTAGGAAVGGAAGEEEPGVGVAGGEEDPAVAWDEDLGFGDKPGELSVDGEGREKRGVDYLGGYALNHENNCLLPKV